MFPTPNPRNGLILSPVHQVTILQSPTISAVAQRKRAGLITLMSLDRNRAALVFYFLLVVKKAKKLKVGGGFQ